MLRFTGASRAPQTDVDPFPITAARFELLDGADAKRRLRWLSAA